MQAALQPPTFALEKLTRTIKSSLFVLMTPRQIFTPLSGSGRSAQAKGVREAQGLAAEFSRQAASLRQEIETKLRKARALECEAWSARMWSGGPAQPSPTLGDALDAGFVMLQIQCGSCHRRSSADLRKVRRRTTVELWTIENSLFCRQCGETRGYRPRAHIVGLGPEDDGSQPNKAQQGKRKQFTR